MAIVMVAFVAIIGGMFSSIVVSDVHRRQATADTILRSAAEALENPQVAPYRDCAATYSAQVTSGSIPYAVSGGVNQIPIDGVTYTIQIRNVAYWNAATPPTPISSYTADGDFSTTICTKDPSGQYDSGLQRIDLVASWTGSNSASETLSLLKRRP